MVNWFANGFSECVLLWIFFFFFIQVVYFQSILTFKRSFEKRRCLFLVSRLHPHTHTHTHLLVVCHSSCRCTSWSQVLIHDDPRSKYQFFDCKSWSHTKWHLLFGKSLKDKLRLCQMIRKSWNYESSFLIPFIFRPSILERRQLEVNLTCQVEGTWTEIILILFQNFPHMWNEILSCRCLCLDVFPSCAGLSFISMKHFKIVTFE